MKIAVIKKTGFLLLMILSLAFAACGKKANEGAAPGAASSASDKGVGPVTTVTLAALDPQLASKGQALFQSKCSACHKLDEKYVGPSLRHVTHRRTPEWIMNMILNPTEMTQKDPVAKELLATHLTQMTFQNVSQDDARAILEYFRQNDAQEPKAP